MCILNCSSVRYLNGSMTVIASLRTSQHGEAPTSPKWMKTIPIALSAHSGYQPNIEACFVDLGGLEKHNFSTALLDNSRSVTA